MMKPFLEPYDLIVAGGGFAGFGAAIQSSRLGMKTLLIEKSAQWGGVAHAGMHQSLCGLYLSGKNAANLILNPGLSSEIADALIAQGQAKPLRIGKVIVLQYVPQALQKIFSERAGAEDNLEVLFEAQVEGVRVQSGNIKHLRFRHQNQSVDMKCRAVMDCTGSGTIIRLSGASYAIARVEERQLAAHASEIGGVQGDAELLNLKVVYQLAQAAAQGVLAPHLRFSVWLPGAKSGQGVLRISILPGDANADIEKIRQQAEQVYALLQKALPEFEHSKILCSATQAVEREGLRMCGRYTLTKDDVLHARKFEDGVVKSAWPVEFWDQRKGPRYEYLEDGQYYEIPLRCLQSKDISNLFSAGRCISADPQALASARVTGTCLSLGEQAANAVRAHLRTGVQSGPGKRLNIVQLMQEETKNLSRGIALYQNAKSISYEDLWIKTEQLAQRLKELPVKKYARVGLLVHEGIDYVILNLAVLSLQAVIIPVPPGSTREEIKGILVEMKLDLLIYEKKLYPAQEEGRPLSSAFEGYPLQVIFFDVPMEDQNAFESLNPAFIRFTSGTTGQSKGVVLSHESILSRTTAADQALKITPQDRVIWVLSMAYHFIVTILLFLRRGATIILCEHEIPKGLMQGLGAGNATFIYAAPVHYQAMISTPEIMASQCAQVRMAVSTTTHLSARIAGAFSKKFGFELSTAYGVIELGLPFVNNAGLPEKCQSVGRLVPGYECRLAAPDQQGVGIVQLKGPGMFEAYFSPWQTQKKVTTGGGWFETGDLGCIDEQGFLFLLGRHQQVINFLGMKIFPREIEDALEQNPIIEQAHVYAEEHSIYGQMPCAKIVLKPGQSNFDEDELRKFCYARLPSYKVPKKFECVGSLKKTKSGKVKLNQ